MRCAWACLISLALWAQTASAQEAAPPTGAEPAPRRFALLPTHTIDIDPAVAGFVDRALARAAQALGYELVDAAASQNAQHGLALPLSLADLWRVTHLLRAELGVSAIASAERGSYTLHVRVASSDGRGPFHARGAAGSVELEATAERLLAEALAPLLQPASASPPVAAAPAPAAPPGPAPAPTPTAPPHTPLAASARPVEPAAPPDPPRFRLALHNDLAFGLAEDAFFNDVLGARFDVRLDSALFVGVHAGYANLQGRDGRVHGFLPYAQVEQRIVLGAGPRSLSLPLRLGLGYLLRNGGFMRLSSGLAIPLGAHTELVLDLLAPAFWTTRDKTLFSLDAGLELNLAL